DRVALDGETQKLIHVAMKMVEEANEIRKLSRSSDTLLSQHVGALNSLVRLSTEVAKIGQATRTATTNYIYDRLLMEGKDHDVRKLLSHFEPGIRAIIGNTIGAIGDNSNALLHMLEACYEQLSGQHGKLHIEGYFATLNEAAFAQPYDPDFEAEQYFDHETRLQVDVDYAEAESMHQQRRFESRLRSERKTEWAWFGFWVQLLNKCFRGPTLFWPLADKVLGDLPKTPRYIFRTFDSASSGKSDGDMVASSASIHMPRISRVDLLSLEPDESCKRLCDHLQKKCFGNANFDDNLMSWSSSLLFVLQYAIWRCNVRRCSPAEVSVCVVDTTKFPHGQFARDMWSLEKYDAASNESADLRKLLHLRKEYDNGEYLSQGALNHKDRSSIVTLEKLIRSGLHDLHPEFANASGGEGWTSRVRELRLMWAECRSTTHKDVQVASRIATTCFHTLSTSEIAICLLTFKARDYPKISMKSKLPLRLQA
ncbi:hypothetical protein LTR49_028481, partial [Elasticomyces elasticus]